MKNLITVLIFLIPFIGFSQIELTKNGPSISIKGNLEQIEDKSKIEIINHSNESDVLKLSVEDRKISGSSIGKHEHGGIHFQIQDGTKIKFAMDKDFKKVEYCFQVDGAEFKKVDCTKNGESNKEELQDDILFDDPLDIPVPEITNLNEQFNENIGVVYILGTHSESNFYKWVNGMTYKMIVKNKDVNLKINSNLPILILPKSYKTLEKIKVDIEGTDYSYKNDLGDDWKKLTEAIKQESQGKDKNDSIESTNFSSKKDERLKKMEITYARFIDVKYLYPEEYNKILLYQRRLEHAYSDMVVELQDNNEEYEAYKKLMDFYPDYIVLKPISPSIPDKDEITIKVNYELNDSDDEVNVYGPYLTKGGWSFSKSGNLFVTNLANNSIITESKVVNNDTILIAKLNEDKKYSPGLGLSYEFTYRTGRIWRPGFNLGFFVPFDEEITPFAATGFQNVIANRKVKFSVGIGGAAGFVNKINEKYNNKDLNDFTNYTEDLYSKGLDFGWQINIGVSYNIE